MKVTKVKDKYEEIIKLVKGKSVLDIGCVCHSIDMMKAQKDKWIHKIIKDHSNYTIGVDIDKKSVEYLNENGYVVVCRKVDEPEFDLDMKFDVVFAGDVMEHLDNLGIFLKNVRKHLKKDGKLGLTTDNPFFFMLILDILKRDEIYVNPDHTCWLDPRVLDQLMKKNGFRIDDIFWVRRPKWYRLGGIPMRIRKYFHFSYMAIAKPMEGRLKCH